MAGRKENIKALFSNTKTRIIILLTLVLLLATVAIGVFKFKVGTEPAREGRIKSAPGGIRSIPGSVDQTAQYAALQEIQNVEQAKKAGKTGSSAIPTIIRTQAFGEGVGLIMPENVEGGVGFTALGIADDAGAQRSLWLQNLKEGKCSAEVVKRVADQGAPLSDLKSGCSCAALKEYGYTLRELVSVCTCPELKAAGFNATNMKAADFDIDKLRRCGFSACEVRGADFTAKQMAAGGYTQGELKGAGFPLNEVEGANGLPDGVTVDDVRKAGCVVSELEKMRKKGVSAAEIVRISGCDAAALKAAGFSAKDLKDAGFSAAELKAAGFSAKDLKDAGFSAAELKAAGFSAKDLKDAGFSAAELKAAGFSAAELKAAGFTPNELKSAGINTVADDVIRAAGCDPLQLKKLKEQGVTAKQIRDVSGCSAASLKAAGFDAKELIDAGFTPAELMAAGFTADDLKAAGKTQDCSVESLKAARAAGVSVAVIKKTLGCSAGALKAAGFSAKELKDAGFSAAELKAAGFSAKELKDAGYSAAELKAAGFSAKDLKDAGFSAAELKAAGFSAKELKDAGFSAAELKAAGFSAKELKDAGFSAAELKAAGFSATELKNAGMSAAGQDIIQSLPSLTKTKGGSGANGNAATANAQQLQDRLTRQQIQAAEQRNQAKVKQRTGAMLAAANKSIQGWGEAPAQVYIGGGQDKSGAEQSNGAQNLLTQNPSAALSATEMQKEAAVIKTGDILFAVLDTSVNSDEPGPILATIVSGRLKGSKLIGSFNLPSNADKMVITFNTLSMLGVEKTLSINAYAIDPDTARTALSSRTNHHYLMKYGSLFASTFMAGFSSAIQSSDTIISVGGTGGTTTTTVQNGVDRSALDNALIGLGEVGKAWAQDAQKNMNRPTTVELFSGTGLGILFTQDVTLL